MSVNNPEIKVVIPSRYGSSSLPGKALLELNGFPLFWHVVQRVKEAGIETNDIYLATDDTRIMDKAKEFGVKVVLTSDKHISGTDRINEVAALQNWADSIYILNVQGDEPLIPPQLIKELVKFALNNNQFDIFTAVTPIVTEEELHNPNIVKADIRGQR